MSCRSSKDIDWNKSQEASNRLIDHGCVLLDGRCDCPYTEDKGYRYPICKKHYDEF